MFQNCVHLLITSYFSLNLSFTFIFINLISKYIQHKLFSVLFKHKMVSRLIFNLTNSININIQFNTHTIFLNVIAKKVFWIFLESNLCFNECLSPRKMKRVFYLFQKIGVIHCKKVFAKRSVKILKNSKRYFQFCWIGLKIFDPCRSSLPRFFSRVSINIILLFGTVTFLEIYSNYNSRVISSFSVIKISQIRCIDSKDNNHRRIGKIIDFVKL